MGAGAGRGIGERDGGGDENPSNAFKFVTVDFQISRQVMRATLYLAHSGSMGA
jgi:hypothetical protein